MKHVATILAAALFLGEAHAGPMSYRCVAESVTERTPFGAPRETRGETVVAMFSFSVDRDDGRIVGGGLVANMRAEVRVLSRGSDQVPYKHVSIWPDLGEFQTLLIWESAQGRRKPFVFTDSVGRYVTGSCE